MPVRQASVVMPTAVHEGRASPLSSTRLDTYLVQRTWPMLVWLPVMVALGWSLEMVTYAEMPLA